VHGPRVSAEVVFHLGVEDEGVENGAQNQLIFLVPPEKGAESPFPQAAVGRIEKGEYLASGELLLLSLHLEAEGEGAGEFIEEGGESRPPGQVFPAKNFFFLFPPGEGPKAPKKVQGMFVRFQGRMGEELPDFVLGKVDQGQAEEKEQVFQLVPLLFGFLQEGFVFVVLGVFGKEKAGIEKRLYPLFLDGFVFFQGLEKSGRGEKRKNSPFMGGLKLPGPFVTLAQVVGPGRVFGVLVKTG
jgi:hypothetical protein